MIDWNEVISFLRKLPQGAYIARVGETVGPPWSYEPKPMSALLVFWTDETGNRRGWFDPVTADYLGEDISFLPKRSSL